MASVESLTPDEESGAAMPEVARFAGIVISMYAEAGNRHNLPHFHAKYGEYRATIAVDSGDLLAGFLPTPQLRLVQAWAELRRAQLDANWEALIAGRAPRKIGPLA